MVELVDTQDLESCEATRAGSIPVIRTILIENAPLFWTIECLRKGFYLWIIWSK